MRKDDKRQEKKNLLEEKVISITRVTKVTSGGRHFRFCATVAVGNRKGLVGIGSGKANEVPEAIKKALQAANKNVCKVALSQGRTIPHEAEAKVGRAVVLVKPAKEGRGIIAGGAARKVFAVSGVKDVIAKQHGAPNTVTNARVTLKALQSLKPTTQIKSFAAKTASSEKKVASEKETTDEKPAPKKAPAKKEETK